MDSNKVVASQDEMNFVEDPAKKDFHAKRRAINKKAKAKAKAKAKETPKQTPRKNKKTKKTKSNKGHQLKTKNSGKMDESMVPLDTFYHRGKFVFMKV